MAEGRSSLAESAAVAAAVRHIECPCCRHYLQPDFTRPRTKVWRACLDVMESCSRAVGKATVYVDTTYRAGGGGRRTVNSRAPTVTLPDIIVSPSSCRR